MSVTTQEGISSSARTSKPLFIEIYAGKDNLSRAMEKLGYDVISVDKPEWDLDQLAQRRRLLGLAQARGSLDRTRVSTLVNYAEPQCQDTGPSRQTTPGGLTIGRTYPSRNRCTKKHQSVLDQCAYGAELPASKGERTPIRKRTRLQADLLNLTCDGSHEHLALIVMEDS